MTSHALPDPPPVWDSSFASAERFLAPSPVWDASLQRRKLIEHAVDAEARVAGGRVGLIAEPLVAQGARGTVQSVRLQPLADGVARIAPIGMILVPSRAGITHSPDEFTSWKECWDGGATLMRTVLEVDRLSLL